MSRTQSGAYLKLFARATRHPTPKTLPGFVKDHLAWRDFPATSAHNSTDAQNPPDLPKRR
jgi:hypothetical protein